MNEHVNMAQFIAPKSDQINSDDLIGGPRTITVTRVTGNEGNAEQPVNIFYEGDDGKPFRPCKSMRRVMVKIWGADASKYAGRSMTIYRDPKVKWGGMEVGGIRISHMTGIDKPEVMALTETRAARKPFTVHPLTVEARADDAKGAADKIIANIGKAPDAAKLDAYLAGKPAAIIDGWRTDRPELAAAIDAASEARRSAWATDEADPFADEPVYAAAVRRVETMLGSAYTDADVDAAFAELEKHRTALPDDVAAELDGKVLARRGELVG